MGRRVAAGAAAIVFVLVTSACAFVPTSPVPPEKTAIESAAAVYRSSAPRADKSSDPGRPVVVETDPPPEVGLFANANAPAPGGVFTPSNEWAGWIDAMTFVQVWAGEQPDFGGRGALMVMRRSGVGDGSHLDPETEATQTFVAPPSKGGRLTITEVRNHLLVIRNPNGTEFEFDPETGAFVTP
jgi:hypothetical protein